jgi:multidrug transporter EmrE-like cation transporter
MIWIFAISMVIVCELVADIFSKEYSLKGGWPLWVAAIISYIITNAFWLWSMRSGAGLARGAVIFSVFTAIGASIAGIYFYGESTNKIQLIGMALGVLSLILIFWE